MSTFLERNARRLLIAGGLTLVMGVPTIACMGGADVEVGGGDEDDGGDDKKEAATPESKVIGTWQMRPPSDQMRNFKIIDAALSGKPAKLEKLGKLKGAEQTLFDEVKGMKGPEKKMMMNQLKFMKQSKLIFTKSDVTVQFGADEKFGPVKYTVSSATDSKISVKFDPGLGNGTETHTITWKSADKGVDQITASNGTEFIPLDIGRVGK
ncbi:MAG: hypothetical protein ACI8PZ_000107 [Myxococcota bacterium]|jgi:hypothetical protein